MGAFSDPEIYWITFCPRGLSSVTALAPSTINQDISTTQTYIQRIRPLSTMLMHEFYHLLYPEFSK